MTDQTGLESEAKQKPSFEKALEELQATVKRLESGELNLEDALREFESGVRLSRMCQETLAAAEQRVEQLMKVSGDGKPDLQPFTPAR